MAGGLVAFTTLVVVLLAGWPVMLPVACLTVALGLHEYRGMLRRKGIAHGGRSMYVFGIALVFAALPGVPGPYPGLSWREVTLAAYLAWTLISEVVAPHSRPLERVVYSLFGIFYLPFLLSYGLLLRYTPDRELGFWYLLVPIVAAYASDVGGFAFGALFGRRKLAPEVSPNKTVEGAIGGIALSAAFVFALSRALQSFMPDFTLFDDLLFAVLVASAAQLGDLAESVIKRSLGAKDSGTFLPGHGGLLDRIDSMLFALPVAFYFVSFAVLG